MTDFMDYSHATFCHDVSNKNLYFIVDRQVSMLYCKQLTVIRRSVNSVGFYDNITSENDKTMKVVMMILDDMQRVNLKRDDVVVAIGGGVTSDIAGFVASIYRRGITWVVIPTTLLAMIDAAIGGKTAVNTTYAKNALGTIWLPQAVYYDASYLKTLPEKEWLSGMGECIKYHYIAGEDLGNFTLNDIVEHTINKDVGILIKRCAQYKQSIVNRDLSEKGCRQYLNFGHTTGHAIELANDFQISHGQAVIYGMAFALYLSLDFGLAKHIYKDYCRWLTANIWYKLDVYSDVNTLLNLMIHDKKNQAKTLAFVVLTQLGKPQLERFTQSTICNKLEAFSNEISAY